MKPLYVRNLKADVLVIGTGGAGLRAAIEAKNMGADVLVVSKGGFPSGCTAIAMGAMLAAFDSEDSPNLHFEDTMRGGDYLNNPSLVRLLVDHARERTVDLEGYGTTFEKENDHYQFFPFTGSSAPRGVLAHEPYQGGYIKGLVNEVKRLSINVLENVMIIDLVKGKNEISGAIGLALETDILVVINTQTIILATGGAGDLYRLTTNPVGLTGDGYALAYKAGARLSGMEFVQGRVCMIYPKGMRGVAPPGDGLVTKGGRFYNSLCERYMRKYHPDKLELVTRAQMSICAQREIQAGRGTPNGGVFGDLSGVPEMELSKFERFLRICTEENFDPSWQPYEWAPGVHHFMGGVVINEKCETGIEGLYAAGEIAAGVHGANRLAANALTETQVFGAIAGENAAKRAFTKKAGGLSPERVDAAKGRIEAIGKREKGFDAIEVKAELTEVISLYAGVIRNEDGLLKAAKSIENIKKNKLDKLCLVGERSLKTVSALLEVENLVMIGELVTSAARLRTETRGAHNREDYPELDEGWSRNIVFHLENGKNSVKMSPGKESKTD